MELRHPHDPASPAQLGFLKSLLYTRAVEEKWVAVANQRIETGLDKENASKMIEWFKSQPAKDLGPDLARGVYIMPDGAIAAVRTSKTTGRPYAMKWTGRSYEFVGGWYNEVRATARPLPVEDAMKMGLDTGWCVICGKELSDPKSLERGIGPVCYKSQAALGGTP